MYRSFFIIQMSMLHLATIAMTTLRSFHFVSRLFANAPHRFIKFPETSFDEFWDDMGIIRIVPMATKGTSSAWGFYIEGLHGVLL